MELRTRRRLQALLIASVFAAPVLVALVMGLLGWIPHGRSYGQALKPERDLSGVSVQRADGKPYAFANDDAVWTLVALPGPDCANRCLRELDLAHRAKISLGQHADKLHLVYLGAPPAGSEAAGFDKVWTLGTTTSHALDDLRPGKPDTVSAVLVTPHAMALTWYAADFDARGLRQDLAKVVH